MSLTLPVDAKPYGFEPFCKGCRRFELECTWTWYGDCTEAEVWCRHQDACDRMYEMFGKQAEAMQDDGR